MPSPQPWLSLYNDFAPGNGGAWSSITGTPTEVAYFDGSGNGTSDANFTTTGTTFNLLRSPAVGDDIRIYLGDDALGFGVTGAVFINETVSGLNGVTIVDATPFGGSQDQSFYGFFNPAANQNANMTARYNAGTDEANLDWEATNSTNVGSRMQLNSRSTGTSAGFTVYGPNNSGSNSVFAVRDAGSSRLLFLDNDGNLQINNAWYLINVDGLNGQVLHTNGAGQSYWATISTAAALTQNYIGFGSGLNELTGDSSFTYDFTNLEFIQTIPDNTGNSGATTSPLSFGAISPFGSGLTLNWSSADYKSNKYGGKLTIQIDSNGTPDTFSWFYTGGYSQVIGSGTGVAITGLPQVLSDSQGRRIGEITFGSTTGHTIGDTWSAGTSLSTYSWGQKFSDGNHNFIFTQPVYGQYYIGDGQYLTDLGGNGTRHEVADQLGEFSIYSPRYFRVETPGGNTQALVDMQNSVWTTYTNQFLIRDTGDSATYLAVQPQYSNGGIGDWLNIVTGTTVTVAWGLGGQRVTLTGNKANGTEFWVDGLAQQIKGRVDGDFLISDVIGNNYIKVDTVSSINYISANTSTFFQDIAGNNWGNVNPQGGVVAWGDLSNTNHSSTLTLDDPNYKLTFTTGGTDRFIAYKDWVFLGGAVVFGSVQTYTSTGSVSINDTVSTLQYNPASVNATATITLPALSGGTGSQITIVFGGTITSGNPVVTALTIAPGAGNTIVDSNPPTTANAGDSLKYEKIGSYWYRV